jgi:ubiquinone biosynthesis protein UbiJ
MTVSDTLENQAKLREIYEQIDKLKREIEQLEKKAEVLDEISLRGN